MSVDFQAALDEWSGSGSNTSDPIAAIYNILPTYSPKQQKLLFVMNYFVARWDLDDISDCLDKMKAIIVKNKNLGMIQQQSLKSLLSAYTQNEMIRGIKVQALNDTSQQ